MTQARRARINQLAETVREAFVLDTPLDVDEAINRLNGTLRVAETADFEAKIEKREEGFTITLAGTFPYLRRRFSIAHEIGHLFLHMGYLVDNEKWASVGDYTDSVYFRYGFSEEESEANEFAAAILMPKAEFLQIAAANKNANRYRLSPIAEHFNVSEDAAKNRGRWLGIFSWD